MERGERRLEPLNVDEGNPEKKVGEFIGFLPVIAYDGSTMRQIDAGEVLDIALAGTSATLLARRWESALLVNVDNDTLRRLMANEDAMRALMSIEGFRSLNEDISTIINKSEAVKKAKKESDTLTPNDERRGVQVQAVRGREPRLHGVGKSARRRKRRSVRHGAHPRRLRHAALVVAGGLVLRGRALTIVRAMW